MKQIYETFISSISSPHGSYPGLVDASIHMLFEDGTEDGYETVRVALGTDCINEDGSYNNDAILDTVISKVGTGGEIEEFE